ncbi:hypothetical protein CkaCkLH20_10386 [Colletotrichum karsti]|uniref:Uncharacterized protein n=1 Tax=Colletotrichum karsti TaxID=1095194 RepID=A0A9P6HX73_9PEZI|nr:uncharacterized protein CkaCkLH20_10386 [Colletotrichum karsti]KAF9872049.1 hypothetical protein CkaCkLH20_10386 [Colletotrichum karsti]
MANVFRQATSWLYAGLAVTILGTWSLIVLILLAGTAISQDPGLIQLIALPSLLTFLVAKLIVAASAPVTSRGNRSGNLATWIATADNGSPHGALALLLFSVTWLLHLARIVFMFFLFTLFGVFYFFVTSLDEFNKEEMKDGGGGGSDGLNEARQNFTTAVVEFEEKLGWSFSESLQDEPWFILQVVAATWAMSSLLMVYVVAYGFGALRKVLTTPLEAWARGSEAPAAVEGVRREAGTAVVVEKEKVVVQGGGEATS